MKTTKRILALITALVLCLAPMTLMVGAAENDIVPRGLHCSCNPTRYTVLQYGYSRNEIQKTALGCYITYYYSDANTRVKLRCNTCHIEFYTDSFGQEYTHPTFYTKEVNGETVFYCPACGYERP